MGDFILISRVSYEFNSILYFLFFVIFMVFGLMLRSLILLELNFVKDSRCGSILIYCSNSDKSVIG